YALNSARGREVDARTRFCYHCLALHLTVQICDWPHPSGAAALESIMAGEMNPGQWVTVTVTAEPATAAGRKTLKRLFEQDPAVRKQRDRLAKTRQPEPSRRGGRIWINKPPHLELVDTKPGESHRVFASVSVLRDLKSVEKYVDIKPAG